MCMYQDRMQHLLIGTEIKDKNKSENNEKDINFFTNVHFD